MVDKQDYADIFSIIDPKMTVKAMRDSGYKSTAYALAELIDNSIESEATEIEVFGLSAQDKRTGVYTLKQLAVLDNGIGMDRRTLRGSLRYGHSTRRERQGIGRFGLGLPNSSMSQAKRVDVWSWQSGITNAQRTHLDLDEVEQGVDEISEPVHEDLPQIYREFSRQEFGDSGTLVVWSDLDRVAWKRASTTFKHTELLVGRIYRRFLADPSERLHVSDKRNQEIGRKRFITFIPISETDRGPDVNDEEVVKVRPNDPLYLMNDTSCPEEFGPGPMFTELQEWSPLKVEIPYGGEVHDVWLRASYVKLHARDKLSQDANWPSKYLTLRDSGSASWGKHAQQNLGISIVRAHRELQLDDSWTNQNTTERWWTVEIDFPPSLDELFEVSNNKQSALTFPRLAKFDWKRELLPGETSFGDVRRRMEESGDRRAQLLDLHTQIKKVITQLRNRVESTGTGREERHVKGELDNADANATEVIKERECEGHRGKSDELGDKGTKEEHAVKQKEELIKRHNFDPAAAQILVEQTIQKGNRVRLIESLINNPAFFDVESLPNLLQVVLNMEHPVYPLLFDNIMPGNLLELDQKELQDRLTRARAALHTLLYAWARFEEEQTERDRKRVRNTRHEWGKYAEEFLDRSDDDESGSLTDLY